MNPFFVGLVAVAACVWTAAPAAAQQTKPQQKCINLLNKGTAKVAKTRVGALRKCAKQHAKNPTKYPDPDSCTFGSVKVQKAIDKLDAKAAVVCSGAGMPSIGPMSPMSVGWTAGYTSMNLGLALISNGGSFFGNLVLCSDAPAKAGCKCQDNLLNRSNKLLDTYFKFFNKCKRIGLKKGPIVDNATLAECLTVASRLDPKSKLPKALTKLEVQVAKRCGSPVTDPLPNGTCATLTGNALAACLSHWTRCTACLTLQYVDGLSVDCDLFDDGQENFSCYDLTDF